MLGKEQSWLPGRPFFKSCHVVWSALRHFFPRFIEIELTCRNCASGRCAPESYWPLAIAQDIWPRPEHQGSSRVWETETELCVPAEGWRTRQRRGCPYSREESQGTYAWPRRMIEASLQRHSVVLVKKKKKPIPQFLYLFVSLKQ